MTMSLAEIAAETAAYTFGDVGLAILVLFACVGVLMWFFNVPMTAMFFVALPFLGALVMEVTQSFVLTLFAMALATIGFFIWIGIGEAIKKW